MQKETQRDTRLPLLPDESNLTAFYQNQLKNAGKPWQRAAIQGMFDLCQWPSHGQASSDSNHYSH